MSLVRFAARCDACGKRSPEYETWASCRECYEHVCPACYVPESYVDADADCVGDPARYVGSGHTALCTRCSLVVTT